MKKKHWLNPTDLVEYIVGRHSKINQKLFEFKDVLPEIIRLDHNKKGNVVPVLKKTGIKIFCDTAGLQMRDIPKSKTPQIKQKGEYDFSPVQLSKYIKNKPTNISQALKKYKNVMPEFIVERQSLAATALFLHAEDMSVIQKFCEIANFKMRPVNSTYDSKHEPKSDNDLSCYKLAKYIDAHPVTILRYLIKNADKMHGAITEKMDSKGTVSWYLNRNHIKEFCKISDLKLRENNNKDVLSVMESLAKAPKWLSSTELDKYIALDSRVIRRRLIKYQDKIPDKIIEKKARNGQTALYLDKDYIVPFCRLINVKLRYNDLSLDDMENTIIPLRGDDELSATDLNVYISAHPRDIIKEMRVWKEYMPDAIVERRSTSGYVTLYLKKNRIKDFCKTSGLRLRAKPLEKKENNPKNIEDFVYAGTTSEWLSPEAIFKKAGGYTKGAIENRLQKMQSDPRMTDRIKFVDGHLRLHNDKQSIDLFRVILQEEDEEAKKWLSLSQLANVLGRHVVSKNYILKLQADPDTAKYIKIEKISDNSTRYFLLDSEEALDAVKQLMKKEWLSAKSLEKYCNWNQIAIEPRLAKMESDPRMAGRIMQKISPLGNVLRYLHDDPESIALFQEFVNDIWLTPSRLRDYCSVGGHDIIERYLGMMQNDPRMKNRIKAIYTNRSKRLVLHLHDDAESIALFQTMIDEIKLQGLKRGIKAVKIKAGVSETKSRVAKSGDTHTI